MAIAAGPPDALGLVGQTVDQVRFDACVDSGGFGLIYRGQHLGLGETVAIKCLRIVGMQKADDDVRASIAARFRDETKLLYRLSQGNLDIVRCIGSGTVVAPKTGELTPYMVLEWLDGCTLGAEMKERRAQKLPPRSLEATVALLDSAVSGIAYAHSLDVVHRDIKPGNLFITRTRDGGVRMKVLDFGLAKILSDETIGMRPSVETGVGVHFCSPSYGAPEQFSHNLGKIGPWTDVYSLALVLLECMKGEKVRPAGNLAEGLLKAIDAKTASPKPSDLGLTVSPAVEAIFARAVAQKPVDRPHDVGVFWSELKAAMVAPRPAPAATIMDANIGDAMNEVRAAAARASQRPAPLVGTLMMSNAPPGAPHMGGPLPAAGSPPPGFGSGTPSPVPGSSPPGSAPPHQQGQQAGDPSRPPPNKLAMTMPLNAASPLIQAQAAQAQAQAAQQAQIAMQSVPPPVSSPLASSVISGSGPPPALMGSGPPIGMPPNPGVPGQIQPITAAMPSPMRGMGDRPPAPRTDPRANISQGSISSSQSSQSQGSTSVGAPAQIPMKKGGGLVVVVVLLLLLGGGGFAAWWFRFRGH